MDTSFSLDSDVLHHQFNTFFTFELNIIMLHFKQLNYI